MRSFLLAAILPFAAFGADAIPRIAVVDSKVLFDGFKGPKESQEKYDKQVAAWEQEVADKQKELANLKEKFEKQSLMLSEEKKKSLQADFMSKQADLQKLAQSLYGKDGRVVRENEKFTAPIIRRSAAWCRWSRRPKATTSCSTRRRVRSSTPRRTSTTSPRRSWTG